MEVGIDFIKFQIPLVRHLGVLCFWMWKTKKLMCSLMLSRLSISNPKGYEDSITLLISRIIMASSFRISRVTALVRESFLVLIFHLIPVKETLASCYKISSRFREENAVRSSEAAYFPSFPSQSLI